MLEHRPVGVGLALDDVGPEGVIRHAFSGAERVHHERQRPRTADEVARERRHVRQAALVRQRFRVRTGQRERTALNRCRSIVDGQDARDCLLFQPLAHHALRATRALRECRRGRRSALRERSIEAEPIADVDVRRFAGGQRQPEDLVDECVALRLIRRLVRVDCRHGLLLARGAIRALVRVRFCPTKVPARPVSWTGATGRRQTVRLRLYTRSTHAQSRPAPGAYRGLPNLLKERTPDGGNRDDRAWIHPLQRGVPAPRTGEARADG